LETGRPFQGSYFPLSPVRRISAYHHGNLREAALKAAREAVDREPVEMLSLRSIAQDLGVTHRALYRYFSNKDALVTALAADGFAMLNTAMKTAMGASGRSPRASRAISAYVDFALRRRNLYRVMFALPARKLLKDPELGPQVLAAIATLADAFREPRDPPGISASLRDCAIAAWGFAHGLCDLWHAGALRAQDAAGAHTFIMKLAEASGLMAAPAP
jgi:AcrR family transcriptional regulator